jgi:PAS domain S-box-containing protein
MSLRFGSRATRRLTARVPNRFRMALAALFVAASVGTVVFLYIQLLNNVVNLRASSNHNVQWLIGQLEVEALKFQIEIDAARHDPASDLDDLRERFDLFYSRVGLVRTGYAASLLENSAAEAHLAFLDRFTEETVSLIDGPDAALRAALPELQQTMQQVSHATREVALRSVLELADIGTQYRQLAGRLLRQMAIIASVLLVFLLATTAVIVALYLTSQRRGERLTHALSHLQTTLGATLDSVIILDAKGRILQAGGAFTSMFGADTLHALGETVWSAIMAPDSQDALRREFTKWQTNPPTDGLRITSRRFWAINPENEAFPVELSVGFNQTGQDKQFILFVRDESEVHHSRQRLVASLEKATAAETEKSRFIAVMNHEMRTPLNGIIGGVELMRKTELQPKQVGFVDILDKSAKRLLAQVNRILDITRIESGKIQVDPNWFDINTLLHNKAEIVGHLAAKRNNHLIVSSEIPSNCEVWGDSAILRHVLTNLLSNAIKFTANGTIVLCAAVENDGTTLRLEVRDTGIGIRPENLDRIFEDFYSVDGDEKRYHEGAGLGLGIARRLIEAMNGTISVSSVSGSGSTFSIDLPTRVRMRRKSTARHWTSWYARTIRSIARSSAPTWKTWATARCSPRTARPAWTCSRRILSTSS